MSRFSNPPNVVPLSVLYSLGFAVWALGSAGLGSGAKGRTSQIRSESSKDVVRMCDPDGESEIEVMVSRWPRSVRAMALRVRS